MSKERFILEREDSIDVIHINNVLGLYHCPEYKNTGFSYGVDSNGRLCNYVEERWVLKTIHQQYDLSKNEYENLKKWIWVSEDA
jgi:hypothetical protein